MLDLETLAARPGAVILTLGAVVFDPADGSLGKEFYRRIAVKSCTNLGLKIDPDTIAWWMLQSDAARHEAFGGESDDIKSVITDFNGFYIETQCRSLWCHGANFDEPILSTAYRGLGIDPAWKFWDVRCTRTIYSLAGIKLSDFVGDSVKHNALDDAKTQALAVCAAYKKLGLVTTEVATA